MRMTISFVRRSAGDPGGSVMSMIADTGSKDRRVSTVARSLTATNLVITARRTA
jgi:hypothetical protein